MNAVGKIKRGALVALVFLCVAAPSAAGAQQARWLHQASSISALLAGVYDGEESIADLKRNGDFGLGTFDGLDGEMVMLDGVCHQVLVSGEARVAQDSLKTPFAAVVFFRPVFSADSGRIENMEGLLNRLNRLFPNGDGFYAVRLTGEFEMVKTRSVPKQNRPYPPLVEAAKRQQLSTSSNVSGDLVALYCPPSAAGLNVVGWHVHFLNAQRNRGGHLLDLRVKDLKIEGMALNGLQAILPGFEEYNNARLCEDREAELSRVER